MCKSFQSKLEEIQAKDKSNDIEKNEIISVESLPLSSAEGLGNIAVDSWRAFVTWSLQKPLNVAVL